MAPLGRRSLSRGPFRCLSCSDLASGASRRSQIDALRTLQSENAAAWLPDEVMAVVRTQSPPIRKAASVGKLNCGVVGTQMNRLPEYVQKVQQVAQGMQQVERRSEKLRERLRKLLEHAEGTAAT
eukprot:scaffold1439_cov404-Prasinococcus_capsulatus_cf.AAC.6